MRLKLFFAFLFMFLFADSMEFNLFSELKINSSSLLGIKNILIEHKRAEVEENQKQWHEMIKEFGDELIYGNCKTIATFTVLTGVTLTCIWHGVKVLSNHIDRMLQKPKVIIRSSRESWVQWLKRQAVDKKQEKPIKMIFSQKLDKRLSRIINATK